MCRLTSDKKVYFLIVHASLTMDIIVLSRLRRHIGPTLSSYRVIPMTNRLNYIGSSPVLTIRDLDISTENNIFRQSLTSNVKIYVFILFT